MTDDETPPSFEPGSGRRIPDRRPAPSQPAAPPSPGPQRRPLPRSTGQTPGRAGATAPARPSPGRSTRPAAPRTTPGAAAARGPQAQPLEVRPGSRTSGEVGATRAMPLAGAAGLSASPAGRGNGGSTHPPTDDGPRTPAGGGPRRPSRATFRRRRLVLVAVALVLLLVWPIGLVVWADGRVQHTEALSDAAGTPGRTYLLAGSDSRSDGALEGDTTQGSRTDTIMLLTAPGDGTASLVSLPRDTLVEIPGHGQNKLNAAYSFGGAPLLVQTVEGLSGLKVDHYVEIGMGGVESIVDAVGGVNLCWDSDVDDELSGMVWTAGCHDVDGAQALAFARMRYSDPTGDIGRGQRQQQVIQAVTSQLRGPSLLLPWEQVPLITAGTDALTTDPGTGVVGLGRMALTFRSATGPDGFRGTPPIADPDHRPGNLGSTVLLDEAAGALFWQQVTDGTLPTQAEQEAGAQG
ncbi:LCP family protein [Litorihabitans aurantiacus]|uniref:Cell envelope-related transcriptional attenuator domain-containing protein n=1 Tax=Litorihabitans aurantiacus TaxID=1930061 RepID=A0AA37UP92_9MICO|nr:LCP family protein [Litorihabitans aurantiacus]GMA30608.1 hypothetical protein GCM10025875_06000 [Litorihabitans aurantiacus]